MAKPKLMLPACRFELNISAIRLLDFYGGAADLTAQEYFDAKVSCSAVPHLGLQS